MEQPHADPREPMAIEDGAWDAFLRDTPGGCHLQSSAWGRLKSAFEWRALRVVVSRDGRLAGGAQVLVRDVHAVGSVGYVPRGPVLADDDPLLRRRVLDGMDLVARRHRIRLLVVQPPAGHDGLVPDLRSRGFRPAEAFVEPHPALTLILDLAGTEADLLAGMRSRTRHNIRLAERRGVVVREGNERDVATLHRLLTLTAGRKRFTAPAREYLEQLVRLMSVEPRAAVLVGEVDGEPVAGALLVAFGPVVTYKRAAWSGQHGHRHPNEALAWAAMRWARRAGYRWFDFEGLQFTARAGSAIPDDLSRFKLGFGGAVVPSPGAYQHVPNLVLRHVVQTLGPLAARQPLTRRVVELLRTR